MDNIFVGGDFYREVYKSRDKSEVERVVMIQWLFIAHHLHK